MHAYITLLLTFLLLTGCGADSSSEDKGDSWAEAQAAGEATVQVLYVPAADFAYIDEDGTRTGVTVELMRLFANWVEDTHDIALTIEWVEETDWQTFYKRVEDAYGGVFGLGNVTITEERRNEVQFSPPYLTNIAVLITHEDVPELTYLDNWASTFNGLTPLAFEGTLHEERLRDLHGEYGPDLPLAFSTSNDDIIARVASGGYVAYIDGYNYWRAVEEEAPLRRHPIADDPAETFGIIMPRASDWSEPVQAFFQENGDLRERPIYRDLLVEHLGEAVVNALDDVR